MKSNALHKCYIIYFHTSLLTRILLLEWSGELQQSVRRSFTSLVISLSRDSTQVITTGWTFLQIWLISRHSRGFTSRRPFHNPRALDFASLKRTATRFSVFNYKRTVAKEWGSEGWVRVVAGAEGRWVIICRPLSNCNHSWTVGRLRFLSPFIELY